MKNIIRKVFVVFGLLGIIFWLGVGDEILSPLALAFAIVIGLVLHLFIPMQEPVKETKIGETELKEVETKKTPEEVVKDTVEVEKARLKAELEQKLKDLDGETTPQPKEVDPKKQPKQCQFCEKVCRNETDYKRHIAFKHLDKIKLDIDAE